MNEADDLDVFEVLMNPAALAFPGGYATLS